MTLGDRLKHGWNAFINPAQSFKYDYGRASYIDQSRPKLAMGNEKSIVAAVYNRIAVDVSQLDIRHVLMDNNNEKFKQVIDDPLNERFSVNANKDQESRTFIRDLVLSLFDEGAIAVIPIDTDINPKNGSYDINSLRVGKIVNWYPDDVRVRCYNDKKGEHEELMVPKAIAVIIENPFYTVMNEPNSIAKRLIRKLNLLDVIDDQSASGKLDLIIQFPGSIKTEQRIKAAEDRRKKIEDQLAGSKYGIAYIDSTEKVTQLNRAVENNLMNQITFLTSMLYSQLGISEKIMNGTANEQEMLNYYNNTIVPVISTIVDNMRWKFLTKTARSRHHSIMYFRDPFKNTPVNNIAELADKFTRNEIASSNEMRSVIGWKPVDDPRADELRNKNLNSEAGYQPMYTEGNGEGGLLANSDIASMKLSQLPKL